MNRYKEGEDIILDGIWMGVLLIISIQDIRYKKIENKWILVLLICDLFKGFSMEGVVGALLAGIIFFIILVFAPSSFGGGDVKLSVVAGYYLGAEKWFYSFAIAVFLAGMVIFRKYILRKINKKEEIAFGPYLCLGIVIMKVFA
ncbi:prepilin peptidase [Faecalimonas sp.]